jgi:hypothetical protein
MDLSGFIIKDQERAFRVISGAENVRIYETGQKVRFENS